MHARTRLALLLLSLASLCLGCEDEGTGPTPVEFRYLRGLVVDSEGSPVAGAIVALDFFVEPIDPADLTPPPFRNALAQNWSAPQALRVEVFDLQRERVRLLFDSTMPAGPRVLPWDGRNDSGEPVSSGLYILTETVDLGSVVHPPSSDYVCLLDGESSRLLTLPMGAITDEEGRFRSWPPLEFLPAGTRLSGVLPNGQSLASYRLDDLAEIIVLFVDGESIAYITQRVSLSDRSQDIELEIRLEEIVVAQP